MRARKRPASCGCWQDLLAPARRQRQNAPPMAYALSFSEDFFVGKPSHNVDTNERPRSVLDAIVGLRTEAYRAIAKKVFGVRADQLSSEAILAKIIETNTCTNLDDPAEVWIDPAGNYTLRVHSPAHTLSIDLRYR